MTGPHPDAPPSSASTRPGAASTPSSSAAPPTPFVFRRSRHLDDLIVETDRLVAVLAEVTGPARDALSALREDASVLANLRLDGSRLERLPATEDLPALLDEPTVAAATERPGTWLDAMGKLREDADEAVQALETLGVRTALRADDLDEALLTDPDAALPALHRRLTRGLVAPGRAGIPRRSDQAVHDASIGRILYFPTDPAAIPHELAALGAWLAATGSREHGLVTSGMLHLELLRIHPFEAANGRLARVAARLVLRARGLDPGRLTAFEPVVAADALGYHEEVARTLRRRDATIWLERWGEAVTDALRAAMRPLRTPPPPPERATAFLSRPDAAFTVAEYRAEAAVGHEDAGADLRSLLDAGMIRRVPATGGLRYLIEAPPPA